MLRQYATSSLCADPAWNPIVPGHPVIVRQIDRLGEAEKGWGGKLELVQETYIGFQRKESLGLVGT